MNSTVSFEFDHLAIAVNEETYRALRAALPFLGWEIAYETDYVGDETTGMRTFVAKLDRVQLAFMYGVSKGNGVLSQITEYLERCGNMKLQHIAIRTNDIEAAVDLWHKKGVSFLTSNGEGKPMILRNEDADGVVFQSFTDPFVEGLFFEIKMIAPKGTHLTRLKEFRDPNIEVLWTAVDLSIRKKNHFRINLAQDLAGLAGLNA